MAKIFWRTAWQGQDIVVYRDDAEFDRVPVPQIERVVMVHRGPGDSPGDVVRVLVELDTDCLLFSGETGFAGRVNFERQPFWAERACIYWVNERHALLPFSLRRGFSFLPFAAPAFIRAPRARLDAQMGRWPLEGPQTWEQRKWRSIEARRPFAPIASPRARA